MNPSHADLVHAAHWWLKSSQRHTAVLSECGSAGFEMPDVIGWLPNGFSSLVECKTTRSDFLADRAKPFRRAPSVGMGYCRWFFVPKGLLKPEEMPEGWGLAELRGARVFKLKKPTPFVDWNQRHEIELLISAVERLTVGFGARVFSPVPEHAIRITGDEVGLFRDLQVEYELGARGWQDRSAEYDARLDPDA